MTASCKRPMVLNRALSRDVMSAILVYLQSAIKLVETFRLNSTFNASNNTSVCTAI